MTRVLQCKIFCNIWHEQLHRVAVAHQYFDSQALDRKKFQYLLHLYPKLVYICTYQRLPEKYCAVAVASILEVLSRLLGRINKICEMPPP